MTDANKESAAARKVGYGLDKSTEMGPVITPDSRQRVEQFIETGENEGGKILVDGRGEKVENYGDGNWIDPTIMDEISYDISIARPEGFGHWYGSTTSLM